jgi:hypothetical protein
MNLFDEPASVFRRLFRLRWRRYAVVGLLCSVVLGLSIASMRRESVTIDEPMNLTAGFTYGAFGDYRLNDTNGILPQRWFALPLLFMPVKFPSRDSAAWHQPNYLGVDICGDFIFASGNDPDTMIFRGRLMALAFGLAVVVAVYGWTTEIFGSAAGLLACFFCALCPTMLAHGHLMTLDTVTALCFLMSVGCFWLLLHRFTVWRLAASTACFGLLLVSKMSAPLFVPMALVMFVTRVALRRPWPIRIPGFRPREVRTLRGHGYAAIVLGMAHAIGAWVIIWSFFGWRFRPAPDWDMTRDAYTEPFTPVLSSLGSIRPIIEAIRHWRLLPEGYIYGLAHTLKHVAERPAFLNGHYSTTGWWYYFPYCFLVKTTLPLLICAALGLGYWIWRAGRRRAAGRGADVLGWLDRTSPIWSLILVYGLAAIFTRLNIGHRLILPIYPVVFSLAGAGSWWLMRRSRWGFGVVGLLLLLQIEAVASIHPYYLSYFNPLAGGPSKGYRHLTDSNVDWGQDLPSLADWLREHRSLTQEGKIYVNCFSYDQPDRWGISAYTLPFDVTNPHLSSADPVTCEPGLYCVSATALVEPRQPWTLEREREYQLLLADFQRLESTAAPRPNDPDNRKMWMNFLSQLATCQYDRLRSYLVRRNPDAMVGYSILIYRLSSHELHSALLSEIAGLNQAVPSSP